MHVHCVTYWLSWSVSCGDRRWCFASLCYSHMTHCCRKFLSPCVWICLHYSIKCFCMTQICKSARKNQGKFRRKFSRFWVHQRVTIQNLVRKVRITGVVINRIPKHWHRVLREGTLDGFGAWLQQIPCTTEEYQKRLWKLQDSYWHHCLTKLWLCTLSRHVI